MGNTSKKVTGTALIHAKNGMKRRNKSVGYIAAFLVTASSLFVPVTAYASDWEEYAVVCSTKKKVTIHTKDGNKDLVDNIKSEGDLKEYSVLTINRLVLAVNRLMDEGWQPLGGMNFVPCQTMVKD